MSEVEGQERFHALLGRITAIEQALEGDPNIAEPGLTQVMTSFMSKLEEFSVIADRLGKAVKIYERRVAEFDRMAAFLAPAMDGATPPMDGAQVATRAFVDQAVERIAGALRAEIEQRATRGVVL